MLFKFAICRRPAADRLAILVLLRESLKKLRWGISVEDVNGSRRVSRAMVGKWGKSVPSDSQVHDARVVYGVLPLAAYHVVMTLQRDPDSRKRRALEE
jgi:hypothetical protein